MPRSVARHVRLAATALPMLLILTACSTGNSPSGTTTSPTAPTSLSVHGSPSAPTSLGKTTPRPVSTTTTPTLAGSTADQIFARMSEIARVGQLLMIDCPSTYAADATINAITTDHVGSVILDGTSNLSLQATADITTTLQQHAPKNTQLLISTDQEGGLVQRLQGPGFTRIPSAVTQGQIDPATLRTQTAAWATELRHAGINVDLGPVMDTVPASFGPNPPIGDLNREYGDTPAAVSSHAMAVVNGLADAGIDATAKHFPGLGRVTGNTDTTSGVTDTVTTRRDPYLAPFISAVNADVPLVMMSTAIYSKIDSNHPAAFSSTIITGMLRGDLGFRGIVISDDLGAAAQVINFNPGQRAVNFIQAGGDIVLSVVAGQADEMTNALLQKANSDPAFKTLVDGAALRVLKAKQALGLLH